jgi:hypothetical protein
VKKSKSYHTDTNRKIIDSLPKDPLSHLKTIHIGLKQLLGNHFDFSDSDIGNSQKLDHPLG